ncbi:hypothetical protein GSI_05318 [Ganoderma sinense ZZ0214-1]|uniref:DUF8212 domain-containing protein n=1 Tax=Ganoderma sinense ZZ0214-1 TaxID=1077348 RepID=A0A2G8SFR0_9APHY|nr:hypothetical protein GSI_05318 [Ganoderma sinense ZZ0214-1]
MYDWYSYAKTCYVFLPDVSSHEAVGSRARGCWETEFRQSQWFSRGWTLQELLAPNVVIFFSKDWQVLGSKHALASLVEDITSIEAAVIKCKKPLNQVSVAGRMTWAASRKTTREEDRAYSLLGIFGVNIRIVYGEGSYAFYRLQEAIIDEIPDQTIFAWQLCPPQKGLLPETFSRPSDAHRYRYTPALSTIPSARATPDKQLPELPSNAPYDPRQYLLANSPDDFANSSDLAPLSREELVEILHITPADTFQTFKSTAHGISTRLPLVEFTTPFGHPDSASLYLALLACTFGGSKTLVALLLRSHGNAPSVQASQYVVGTTLEPDGESPPTPSGPDALPPSIDNSYVRATVLNPEQAAKFCDTFAHGDIFIANRPPRAQHKVERDLPLYRDISSTRERFHVKPCGWSSRLLTQQGYTMSSRRIHSLLTLDPGILLEDVATRFIITRDGVDGGPSLEVQVGRLRTNDAQGLGVAVLCGGDMDLADGSSSFTHKHHSYISDWDRQGSAATKELDLVSLRGTELTLRLVFTHESNNVSRGAAGSTGSSYRLGAEIFDIWDDCNCPRQQLGNAASSDDRDGNHAPPQMTREANPWHIPSLSMSPRDRGRSGLRR